MITAASLADRLDGLAAELTAAGVPATTNPNRIKVPGAFVALDSIAASPLARGAVTGTAAVHLIARDAPHHRAVDALANLLDSTLNGVEDNPARIDLEALQLPTYEIPLPTMTLIFEL
ncbi:hypothetical protein [Corynebacterium striatum]|uniref:hypothetical protein n=1 Tax=Corynebacterium striatum TaxID=43770 RepID=UPI0034D4100C